MTPAVFIIISVAMFSVAVIGAIALSIKTNQRGENTATSAEEECRHEAMKAYNTDYPCDSIKTIFRVKAV